MTLVCGWTSLDFIGLHWTVAFDESEYLDALRLNLFERVVGQHFIIANGIDTEWGMLTAPPGSKNLA